MTDDPHFRQFKLGLEQAIRQAQKNDPVESEEFLQRQRRQVDQLVSLEKAFKRALISHSNGLRVYRAFIKHICEDRRNILDARPFFRERQHVFTREISKALRRRSERALFRFNFNFRFVQFALNACRWKKRSRVMVLAQQIREVRSDLVTMNMPLAISRARIFFSRTPKAHLSYMDLIQIASEGLMSGIDKFVPPFSKAFRSVVIGRMTGNFIEQYCVDPATKVLTSSLRWVHADLLKVGEELVGFDEENSTRCGRRKWRKSVVTATGTRQLSKRAIRTNQGAVVVSDEHMFLCVGGKGAARKQSLRARSESPEQKGRGHRWVRASQLLPGDKIVFLCRPWEEGKTYLHGYLKGISDGEGSVSSDAVLSIAQKPGVVCDEIGHALASLHFKAYKNGLHNVSGVNTWCVGGIADVLRFLGEVRPSRLIQKADRVYVGKAIGCGVKLNKKDRSTFAVVEENEAMGVGTVVTLKTSTGTLVTEGLLSHNSETAIHFFPVDKRKIYRANKLMGRSAGVVDYDELASKVNRGVEGTHRTTGTEIANLVAAASVVSADTPVNDDEDGGRVSDRFAAPASCQPDVIVERQDSMRRMEEARSVLSNRENKCLLMKGVGA